MRVFARPAQRFLLAATATATSNHYLLSSLLSPVAALTPFAKRGLTTTSALSFPNSMTSPIRPYLTGTKRFLSSGQQQAPPNIKHIGKEEMTQILQEYEDDDNNNLMEQYCVIDVRTDEEVMATGKLSPSVHTLPVQVIMQANAFGMDEEDFVEAFGFEKPGLDSILVFSCAAGIRSVYACQAAAAQAGYSNLVNYAGGANEWFS